MKVIIKHEFNKFKQLNFRTFEVKRTVGGKIAEVYIPEQDRTIDFSFKEVLILDVEGVLQSFQNEGIPKNDFDFVMNYLEHNYQDPEEIILTFGCLIDSCVKKIKAEKLIK